ncbi:MAG: WYL domain-containing protein, partial [Actinobacteria bacterium]|nr:WYL domain-containing protein [Actinomycetota bacterium]
MAGERIPKIERLLNLTAMLLETRRPLTVEEIGSKMQGYPADPDSFRRQFERDKDELRSAGV